MVPLRRWVIHARGTLGLKQKELADAVGIGPRLLSRAETGGYGPKGDELDALLRRLVPILRSIAASKGVTLESVPGEPPTGASVPGDMTRTRSDVLQRVRQVMLGVARDDAAWVLASVLADADAANLVIPPAAEPTQGERILRDGYAWGRFGDSRFLVLPYSLEPVETVQLRHAGQVVRTPRRVAKPRVVPLLTERKIEQLREAKPDRKPGQLPGAWITTTHAAVRMKCSTATV